MEVSAKELRDLDPNRFQRKYHEWLHYATDHEWWESIEDNFKRTMEEFGVTVNRIFFDLGYSQGDHAGFVGRIRLADWMAAVSADHEFTYADAYSALYLGAKYDGSFIDVDDASRGRMRFSTYVDATNSPPSGVYKNLDGEAWEELVDEQYHDMDVDLTIRRWVEDKADDLYRDLRDEHDALTSEDAFIESCELNEITFEVNDEICT
jgi:hypothetical protein